MTLEFYNSLDISWRCRTKSSTCPRDPESVSFFWLLRTPGSLCGKADDDDDDDDVDDRNYNSDNGDNYCKFGICNSILVKSSCLYLIDKVSRFTW